MSQIVETITRFVAYAKTLDGDEKGEAQVFCDRLFQAFGHQGYKEVIPIFETDPLPPINNKNTVLFCQDTMCGSWACLRRSTFSKHGNAGGAIEK